MQQTKESIQLKKSIKRDDEPSLTELTKLMPASKSAISKWQNGMSKMSSEILKRTSKFIHDYHFHYSAARADYGIISFKNSKRVKPDLFAESIDQKQQESERQAVQYNAFLSAAVPRKERTKKDWENIKSFAKEFPEEIGSELTEFIGFCEYVDLDPEPYIEKFNEALGG